MTDYNLKSWGEIMLLAVNAGMNGAAVILDDNPLDRTLGASIEEYPHLREFARSLGIRLGTFHYITPLTTITDRNWSWSNKTTKALLGIFRCPDYPTLDRWLFHNIKTPYGRQHILDVCVRIGATGRSHINWKIYRSTNPASFTPLPNKDPFKFPKPKLKN